MSVGRLTLRRLPGPSACRALTHGAYPQDMTAVRRILAALLDAARAGASVVGVLVVFGAMAWLLAGRDPAGAGATIQPPLVAGASDEPSSISIDPAPTPRLESTAVALSSPLPDASAAPSPAGTSQPTLEPTPAPTATPAPATQKPTPKPTSKPTPKPTHDPAPEPTPAVFKDSGRFGETLSAGGVSAYLEQREPNPDPLIKCVSGDPDRQGYTEKASFNLRMTWSDPSDAMEPFVGAGSSPYFSVVWFDPGSFRSGAAYVVTVCTRPGDAAKALISVEANGGPPRSYRFTFVP